MTTETLFSQIFKSILGFPGTQYGGYCHGSTLISTRHPHSPTRSLSPEYWLSAPAFTTFFHSAPM